MPYLTPSPEQRKKLASLVANLQAQDHMISWLGEFVLDALYEPPVRFVRVTPDGLVEYEEYTGPKLVEDDGPGDQSEPDEAA